MRNASDCTHVKGDPATIHSRSRIKTTRSQWQRSPWQNWAPNITIQNLFFCTTSAHRNSPCISRVAMWMQAVATAGSHEIVTTVARSPVQSTRRNANTTRAGHPSLSLAIQHAGVKGWMRFKSSRLQQHRSPNDNKPSVALPIVHAAAPSRTPASFFSRPRSPIRSARRRRETPSLRLLHLAPYSSLSCPEKALFVLCTAQGACIRAVIVLPLVARLAF